MLLGREPSLTLGLIGAIISLALAFGVELSAEQVGAFMAVVVGALSWLTRQSVTPYIPPSLIQRVLNNE